MFLRAQKSTCRRGTIFNSLSFFFFFPPYNFYRSVLTKFSTKIGDGENLRGLDPAAKRDEADQRADRTDVDRLKEGGLLFSLSRGFLRQRCV